MLNLKLKLHLVSVKSEQVAKVMVTRGCIAAVLIVQFAE